MTFPLMISKRIIILIGSLAKITREHSSNLVVRVFGMPSGIRLITELFSTLSASEPTFSSQNMAAKSYMKNSFKVACCEEKLIVNKRLRLVL